MVAPVEVRIQASVNGAKQVDDLSASVDKLGKEATDTGVATEKAADGIDRLGKEASQTVGQIDATSKAVSNTNTALKNTKPDADNAAQSIKRVGGSSKESTSSLEELGVGLNKVLAAYAVLQGGGELGNMVKGALVTADAYNNLESRIKLAAGGNEDFAGTMQDVFDVSLRTHSSLETTGDLFAKGDLERILDRHHVIGFDLCKTFSHVLKIINN